MERISKSCV